MDQGGVESNAHETGFSSLTLQWLTSAEA